MRKGESVTRFSDPRSESPGFLLWRATMRWQRGMTEALRPFDLTHVQFVLLACTWSLCRDHDPPNQARVASEAGVDVKMASEVVRRLETKGLITRTRDEADTRAILLSTTKAGSKLSTKAIVAVEKADAEFFGTLERLPFVEMLTKLAAE